MASVTESSDLFYSDLIARFVNTPDAVSRNWLLEEVTARLTQPDTRFVLLTGEPGLGKTGVMSALAAANPGWLRYFVRADSVRPLSGVDTVSLLLRIGHQLAKNQPDLFDPQQLEAVVVQKIGSVAQGGSATGLKIEDLTVSPFRQTALRVEQSLGALAGNLIGIEIARANLEPRMLQPAVLADLALFGPAEVLASKRPDEMIVVLIDGLDEAIAAREAATIVDWLESFPEAPSNVRFVLSSRPHPRLRTLASIRDSALHTIAVEGFTAQVREDARAFAENLFRSTGLFADAPPTARAAAVAALATAARGNFAYLTAYSRSLRSAVQSSDGAMLEELLKFDALPEGLLPLYAALVRRLRRQVELLGRVPVASSTTDESIPAWEGVGQRILSILAVAFAPVSLDQLAALGGIRAWKDDIRGVFQHFVPMLDQSDAGWQFFHPSIGEFLTEEEGEELSDIAVDRRQWDTRVVQHYRKGADWPVVRWEGVDDYGLLNLPRHLARDGGPRAVLPMLSQPLRLAMRDRFKTDLPFRQVVEQGRPNPSNETDIGQLLSDTIFLELLLSGLNRRAAQLEPAVYGLLSKVGRVDEALARANVLQPGLRMYRSLEAVIACAPAALRAPLGPLDGVEMLVTTALGVPQQSGARGLFVGMDRDSCLRDAAHKLAAHDLERALGLIDTVGRELDLDRDKIIAAAIDAAPHRAQELLGRMTSGRSKAALDAAERRPDESAVLSARALSHLAEETLPEQWRILARVFVLTKGSSHDIVERLEREILDTAHKYPQDNAGDDDNDDHADGDEREPSGWRRAAVDVAERIHALVPETARRILAASEPGIARFESADSAVRAAAVWIAWGEPAEARRALEKALTHYRGLKWYGPARDIARAATVADSMDRSWGQALADEAMDLLKAAADNASPFERARLESILEGTFNAFRHWDRARALTVARWMTGGWISGGEWDMGGRGSALALLAMDAAGTDEASVAMLLKECLAQDAEGVRFGRPDATVTGLGLFSADAEPPADATDMMRAVNYIAFVENQMNYWIAGRTWRYFEDPADVLRSMDYPFPSDASWARALAASVAPLASRDVERAVAVTSWLGDPAERMIALAALAAEFLRQGHLHGSAALAAVQEANGHLPVYSPRINLAKVGGGEDVLLYLNPSIRARFESAVHLLDVGSAVSLELLEHTSPYIQGLCHAQALFDELMITQADPSAYEPLAERIGNWDDVLGDLVKFAAVAALGRGDAAQARLKAAGIGNETLRARALLYCLDEREIAAQGISVLDEASAEAIARHGGQLAAECLRICRSAGTSSTRVVERSLARLANSDALSLAHGLPAMVDAMDDGPRSDLLAKAMRAAQGIENGYLQTDALIRIFSSALLAADGALVARIASILIEDGWRSLMEGLTRAMPQLIEAAGPAIVENLDVTIRRAQAVLDSNGAGERPPDHLDGVVAAHLRPADAHAALYQAPQLAPEFLASFLDKADLSPTINRSRDSRDRGMEPEDAVFEQLHGRHSGFSFWMDAPEKTVGQLFDIRIYFDTVEAARDYFLQKLHFLSEGDPQVENAATAGDECFVFGGETDRTLGGHTIRMTNYTYVFRVDRFVVKLYAVQGVFAKDKLTAAHVFRLAEIVERRIRQSSAR